MRAIITKHHGPTNTKPSRISAKAHGLKAQFYSRHNWDELDGEALHNAAAYQYAFNLGWTNHKAAPLICGFIDENTAAHVFPKEA
jgi:hypothetical protein